MLSVALQPHFPPHRSFAVDQRGWPPLTLGHHVPSTVAAVFFNYVPMNGRQMIIVNWNVQIILLWEKHHFFPCWKDHHYFVRPSSSPTQWPASEVQNSRDEDQSKKLSGSGKKSLVLGCFGHCWCSFSLDIFGTYIYNEPMSTYCLCNPRA